MFELDGNIFSEIMQPRAGDMASSGLAGFAFLAHDAARLITGETLYIDGYHIID
jgi:enoyl-[acyl-carrier-protein] reductase (NADH)